MLHYIIRNDNGTDVALLLANKYGSTMQFETTSTGTQISLSKHRRKSTKVKQIHFILVHPFVPVFYYYNNYFYLHTLRCMCVNLTSKQVTKIVSNSLS